MLVTTRILHPEDEVAVVRVEGRLGPRDSVDRLRRALLSAGETHTLLIADLTDATEFTPDAVGVLAEAAARHRLKGGRFAVAVAGEAASVLEGTGLAEALGAAASADEAWQRLKA